jgi:hypothetical protein
MTRSGKLRQRAGVGTVGSQSKHEPTWDAHESTASHRQPSNTRPFYGCMTPAIDVSQEVHQLASEHRDLVAISER